MNRRILTVVALLLASPQGFAGEVTGVVYSAATGQPVVGASLALRAADGHPAASATGLSNADGSFVLGNVEQPGHYRVTVRKTGFRQPPSEGYVTVSDSTETVDGLGLRLWQEGSIGGRIVDPEGELVAEAGVRAYLIAYTAEGRALKLVASAESDDRGDYRLFGLAAGKYIVQVSPPGADSAAGAYYLDTPPSYYPTALSPGQALQVELHWGQGLDGLDLRLATEAGYAAAGTVWNAAAEQACRGCSVQAFQLDADLLTPLGAATRTGDDGGYVLRGLAPGEYRVVARRGGKRGPAGFADLVVRNRHREDNHIEIGIRRPVSGRVEWGQSLDGAETDKWTPALTPIRMPAWWAASRGSVLSDGSIAMDALPPARYRLSLHGLPPGAYLAGLASGGATIPPVVTVAADGETPHMRPVIALDGASVTGRIVEGTSSGKANLAGIGIWLIPRDAAKVGRAAWSAETDLDGSFRIESVPPGDYVAYALRNTSASVALDPANRARFRRHGRRLALRPSGQAVIELRLAPDPGGST